MFYRSGKSKSFSTSSQANAEWFVLVFMVQLGNSIRLPPCWSIHRKQGLHLAVYSWLWSFPGLQVIYCTYSSVCSYTPELMGLPGLPGSPRIRAKIDPQKLDRVGATWNSFNGNWRAGLVKSLQKVYADVHLPISFSGALCAHELCGLRSSCAEHPGDGEERCGSVEICKEFI